VENCQSIINLTHNHIRGLLKILRGMAGAVEGMGLVRDEGVCRLKTIRHD